ncbi:MAG TPA: dipeptide/oligopeptide/nickel ABC transporter permease/ATP-binding protein [Chloroflexota bacterium]|nr:dipeptide/oligopeptide/nickel ABC transporter permease/ATP-binding protein [Chloroflexota bacterium]
MRSTVRALGRDRKVVVGLAIVAALAVAAVAGPLIAPYGTDLRQSSQSGAITFQPPTGSHWLGTGNLGVDILSQLLVATRASVTIGLAAGLLATVIATAVGLTAGYLGGWIDDVLMALTNAVLTIPYAPLLIAVAAYAAGAHIQGAWLIVAIIALTAWAHGARAKRAQVLALRSSEFVLAARAGGEPWYRIAGAEILPNMLSLVAASFLFATVHAVLAEAGLELLGFGQPGTVTWGTMLADAKSAEAFGDGYWWWFVPPGLCVSLFAVGLTLVNYGLDEVTNPRLRSFRMRRPADTSPPLRSPIEPRPPETHAAPLLDVRNLTVDYLSENRAIRVVDHLSFTVHRGEILGLAGESGCGKSTAVHALLRILRPPAQLAGGSVFLQGGDLLQLSRGELRRIRWKHISLVFQNAANSLNPVMRIGNQFVDMFQAHLQIDRPTALERTGELLEKVGVGRARLRAFPHELSVGMRQRVVIAMAMALEPELIILDEPTSALDTVVQRQIVGEIRALQRQLGCAILFVSHDLALLAEIADRIAVMYAGSIVEVAAAPTLLRAPQHPYTAGLVRSLPALAGSRGILTGIPGSPPDLASPPSGCRFHPRCPHATVLCARIAPPLLERTPNHPVACHLHDATAAADHREAFGLLDEA